MTSATIATTQGEPAIPALEDRESGEHTPTSQTRGHATRRIHSHQEHDDYEVSGGILKGQEERPPKPVKFIYSHARLPLRVHINNHDCTNSIIASVKTFFGIHEGLGVSFENERGNNIIPQYENVEADTDIQVRLTQDIPSLANVQSQYPVDTGSTIKPLSSAPWIAPPPQLSRPASRNTRNGDTSPNSNRVQRHIIKVGRMPRTHDTEALSDSDGGSVSVTSSRRDVLASAEISVENIVEGNRRKGAKFESSELPLFKPPQIPMTASVSSASPQKRFNPSVPSPLPPGNQKNFSYTSHAYPSPVSYGHSDRVSNFSSGGHSYARESHVRASGGRGPSRLSGGSATGVFPTPAPTIGSAISDEDVALQLMRLGDPGNIPPPRPSASTADDALSGKAELASSGEYSDSASNGDAELPHHPPKAGPARKKLKALNTAIASANAHSSGDDYDDYNDGSFRGESDEIAPAAELKKSKSKSSKAGKGRAGNGNSRPTPRFSSSKSKSASTPGSNIPLSPYSLPSGQGKASASQLASDEEDLSAKPRCQRCRSSKKGCDRQRPCGRCKDAGIGIEGCVSEDEGNGRKGRFGRHMGVPVKKTSMESVNTSTSTYSVPIAPEGVSAAEAGKKRKR